MKWFLTIMLIVTSSYCALSISQGYRMAKLDEEILKPVDVITGSGVKLQYTRENITTWCSMYERDLYGFDLRRLGCLLRKSK